MDLHLIAAATAGTNETLLYAWAILQAVLGLGMVIFVHELGHFVVAKLCGVKCEKFYLGFDIYGLKLAKFRWGETEYGIGILPLGGYVKMLGQDDNPSNAARERERSMISTDTPGALETAPASAAVTPQGGALDPRSYMAQSVPKRMAIISAGVIMNVIFAVLMAMVAYGMGVRDLPCAVSGIYPGDAAWRAGMRPGDRIVGIEGFPADQQLRFRDLMVAVALSEPDEGVRFKIQRRGVSKPFWLTIKPDAAETRDRLAPTIGAESPMSLVLRPKTPVVPGTRAAKLNELEPGDRVTAIDGEAVSEYADVLAHLARKRDKPLAVSLERKAEGEAAEQVSVTLPPQPRNELGLVMRMGSITAIQAGSPAERARVAEGDRITMIDGQPVGDPLTLPDRMRRKTGQQVTLTLVRRGEEKPIERRVAVRDTPWFEESLAPGSPMSSPELGIAYKVHAVVESIVPGSPAAKAMLEKPGKGRIGIRHLRPGDEIVRAEFTYPKSATEVQRKLDKIEFGSKKPNWPLFITYLEMLPRGTEIALILSERQRVRLTPAEAKDWFNPDRGLLFDAEKITIEAHSMGEAFSLGLRETRDSLGQVYRFLQRLFQRRISPLGLGGPITIFSAAGRAADEGVPELLLFLTMLSANLAVINFLPIPLLDGGHMVFLALEGIMGRAVSERVVVAFHYAGFLFIISLMLFVLSLDFGLISRFSN